MYIDMQLLLFIFLAVAAQSTAADLSDAVITIVSQSHALHAARARERRQQWLQELHSLAAGEPIVLLSHEHWEHGSWTITLMLTRLSASYPDADWFFFATEDTKVDFRRLQKVLEGYDPNKDYFLGHALQDSGPTIIHHYIIAEGKEALQFPNFPSGFIISAPTLRKAARHSEQFTTDFNIDAQYELAVFLKYLRTPELVEFLEQPPRAHREGVLLTHVPELCVQPALEGSCSTAYHQDIPDCGRIKTSSIFFAVKTCEKYHSTRLPVLQQTWAKDAQNSIAYFSEVEDEKFSTINIGVPNTETGHCGKTFAIIERFHQSPSLQDKHWLFIADDDTLLSVPRLCRLLACYNPAHPLLLGEVYGYHAQHPQGAAYVTGGGGMVLSREAVTRISGASINCPSIDYPDDMYLGTVARQLEIDIVHSPLFHQSQPGSYHPAILRLQTPVSFHRHRPLNPTAVYQQYLKDESDSFRQKTEL